MWPARSWGCLLFCRHSGVLADEWSCWTCPWSRKAAGGRRRLGAWVLCEVKGKGITEDSFVRHERGGGARLTRNDNQWPSAKGAGRSVILYGSASDHKPHRVCRGRGHPPCRHPPTRLLPHRTLTVGSEGGSRWRGWSSGADPRTRGQGPGFGRRATSGNRPETRVA